MATLHQHRSKILSTAALILLGLLLGLALQPLQVAAVPPNGNNGVEGRVTALEQFALAADARLDDLEQDVDQIVSDLVDLMILVEELQACTGCGGGGGGGGGGGDQDLDGDGFSPNQGDCDDTDPTTNPGAVEIPDDGRDNDCDGTVDEVE